MTDTFDADADIAVIGMACRFPGAASPDQFWELLRDAREARVELSDAGLAAAGVPAALIAHPDYVKAGLFLADMEAFDAGLFGFSPLDARIMDPQHRHFLECTWEALENAAVDPTRVGGAVGVFAGSGHNAYLPYNLLSNPALVAEVGFFLLRHTGNDKDFLATRASYCFNLTGPSVNVQTACSTSLVAVHMAAQSLLNGECELAIAGGVTIELPHRQGYLYKESEILSPDGHCRPFDASAGGTVFGSGAGVLVLKRLDDALADGDPIHAVIKASAVNNDGAGKVSYLAPSVDGQAAAVQEALAIGGIEPGSVSYVECHGTGTRLGDPIEVAALARAYGTEGTADGPRAIGSVKSNIGHLDTAAGVASLIKVILALQHRQLPATLHYRAPNPAIDFAGTGFFVVDRLRDWSGPAPRRAGVSSLGVGGTNAHVIVEEAPPRPAAAAPARAHQLLLLSARTDTALRGARQRLADWLRGPGRGAELADVAYTLATGRRRLRQRGAVVAADGEAAAAALGGEAFSRLAAPDNERRVVFMFAGGGAQYPNMGRGLYEQEPAYRAAVDECLALAAAAVDFDLKALLYPGPGLETAAAAALERPSRALPALFITQYAQARLWQSWGIEPAALIGHSMGENTAACLAGVLSLRDAIALVALRGQLFETLPAGGMLSVQLGAEALAPLLEDGLGVAAINAPALCVVSGPAAALQAFEQKLAAAEIGCQRIHIDVAAHSAMLDPILPAFERFLRGLRLQPPRLPFISNLSGDWIAPEQATDPLYWVRHLRQTVRFADGVGRLLAGGEYALLEVGPGRTLASLAGLHDTKQPDQPIATSLRHPGDDQPDLPYMLAALGRLWQGGVEPDWTRFFGAGRRRLALPTYAFDHARHWIEAGAPQAAADGRRALDDWFWQPAWLPRPLPAPAAAAGSACLIGPAPLLARLRPALAARFAAVLEAQAAERFAEDGPERCRLGGAEADYRQWAQWLAARRAGPVQLYLVADEADDPEAQLLPLFQLARALGDAEVDAAALVVVTTGAFRLPGAADPGRPAAAALGAALRVAAAELQLPAALIDLPGAWGEREARWLAQEPAAAEPAIVAYRGGQRLGQQLQPCPLPAPAAPAREGGVYLITGGLGGLGLTLARHLARRGARLALLGRRLPPAGAAAEFHRAAGGDAARRIEALRELEGAGAEVLLLQADVADRAALADAIAAVDRRFGRIDGVFHTAGLLDDALLPLKSAADLRRVLAPKVAGVRNLQALLAGRALDCFVLYSSTSAWAGLPGQFDYAAANAFLDAFAQAAAGSELPALAVNWPVWREVGMAAALAGPYPAPAAPLPAERALVEGDAWRYLLDGDDWLIEQHRTRAGATLVPGTGFIEFAYRAAAQRLGGDGAVALRELFLLQPLVVAPGQRVVVSVVFEADDRFAIYSSRDAEAAARGDWLAQHAQGSAARGGPAPAALPLAALEHRCGQVEHPAGGRVEHSHMAFGPRWHNVHRIAYGAGEALIGLRLPAAFADDLQAHPLHPALLDMATGAAQRLLPVGAERAFFVPQSYRAIRVHAPLAGELVSHVARVADPDPERCVLDITIADSQGAELLAVEGFALRRLAGDGFAPAAAPAADAELQALLAEGIDPAEGMAVIDRLLANPGLAQLVVLPHGPAQLARRQWLPAAAEEAAAAPAADRPPLGTEYVAPATELERTLAALWQQALGVGRIGVRDDFFELGGHSLLLIQLVNRAKKQAGVSLPLAQLFGRPTIAGWVELLGRPAAPADAAPARPALKRVRREAYRADAMTTRGNDEVAR